MWSDNLIPTSSFMTLSARVLAVDLEELHPAR